MRDEFYFPSKDGNTEIHTVEWKPEGQVKAVLQICHGMVEHISRYEEFAQFLCDRGYYVVGNDHLGHGKSVQSKKDYGFFEEKHGNACVIGDVHTLRQRTAKKYPGVPYFILGHSMGSIFLRQYIQMYGSGLSGAILIGVVAERNRAELQAGKRMCKTLAAVRGWHYRSQMIDGMVLGEFDRRFRKGKKHSYAEWITSDKALLEKYLSDPMCSFTFTVNAYYGMFSGMLDMQKKESVYMIPKTLPILFAAGTEDPVGNFGKGVRRVYEKYRDAGIQDVSLRLYAGDRHELINETDRQQVYEDLLVWLEDHQPVS